MRKRFKKELWQKILDANPSGREFVKPKEKRVITGAAYLAKMKEIENAKKRVKADKLLLSQKKMFKAMTSIRNGDTPATQKQIDYIEYLKKISEKKYDYYYPRDKYFLSKVIATAFIDAIQNGKDFSFNRGVTKKRKAIQQWIASKEEEIDYSLGINNDND